MSTDASAAVVDLGSRSFIDSIGLRTLTPSDKRL
jgi:hypothetical protein